MADSNSAQSTATVLPSGTRAPDFALSAGPDKLVKLSDFRGRPVILVFYPADWSPVCGDQVALYNEILPDFREYGAELMHDCVQIHGGIGLTFEHDLHLFLRRATVDRALFGTPAHHRQLIADLVEHSGDGDE